MASLVGDESADGKAQIVFAVAALVGSESQWEAAVEDWLKITNGEEFHANEWESRHGLDSYNELAKIVAVSGLHGQGVAIDLQSFRSAFPDLGSGDYAYHKCFIEVVDRLVKVSKERGDTDLKLIFDRRHGQGTTSLLYESLTGHDSWGDTCSFADEISFENRSNPRIQIADMLARETMRGFFSVRDSVAYRQPFLILASADQRVWFDFLMGEYFSQWKEGLQELERRTGLSGNEYFAWITKKNMQDNLNSRIRYMIWNDSRTPKKKL